MGRAEADNQLSDDSIGGEMSRFGEILHGGPVDDVEIKRVRDVVMFEQPGLQARLVRFWALLTLASAIATFGLYANSVAAVIGAMIVAPLMLPIMGLAFGISIGDRRAILSSILVGLGGILTAILVGYLLSFIMPNVFDPTLNEQIMARTSPRLVDLLAALATGLAGAFAIGRRDVSDTLPGVAIAISLVPPLANVGILLGAGRTDLALGSLLLFGTNYFAILLTGSFVFGLMGFPNAALAGSTPRFKHAAVAIVVVMVIAIMAPLAVASFRVLATHAVEQRVGEKADSWLEASEYRIVSTTAVLDDGRVDLVVAGSGELPAQSVLETSLEGQIGGLGVRIEAIPSTVIEFDTE
jgi:uncharacterized hydrophobic protein (TIGR00271 family)